jgi:N-acetylmuramoyl-L-alanine amidase
MAEPTIFTAEDWGAAPPTSSSFPTKMAEGIVVHNTENPNRAPKSDPQKEKEAAFAIARSIQHDHMHNRNPKFADTGQHFTISRGGVIMEGRHGSLAAAKQGKVVKGAHAESKPSDNNRANQVLFGIELEGDNRPQSGGDKVTKQQFAALVELCAWLSFWGRFDSSQIIPHKDVFPGHTDCPGDFDKRIDALKSAVHDRKVKIIQEHN